MALKHMGMRALRCGLAEVVHGGDVIAIERHGELLGYFFLVKRRPSDDERRANVAAAESVITDLREESGLSDDELAAAWDDIAWDDRARREGPRPRHDMEHPSD